jgi:hypothetical protein
MVTPGLRADARLTAFLAAVRRVIFLVREPAFALTRAMAFLPSSFAKLSIVICRHAAKGCMPRQALGQGFFAWRIRAITCAAEETT